MLELIWAPLLGACSLLFDEYSDPRLLAICLAAFEAATCLAAQLGVAQLRDVFVNSLCNFTHLHSPRCAPARAQLLRCARACARTATVGWGVAAQSPQWEVVVSERTHARTHFLSLAPTHTPLRTRLRTPLHTRLRTRLPAPLHAQHDEAQKRRGVPLPHQRGARRGQ
jgi:hypothetical protein